MADPQVVLNNAFPIAQAGDAVVDENTGDVWIKDGSLWVNSGQNPGLSITTESLIPVYNETLSSTSIVYCGIDCKSLNYKLEILSEVDPISIVLPATVDVITVKIDIPGNPSQVNIGTFAPTVSKGKAVRIPQIVIVALIGIPPSDIKASIQVQAAASIGIAAMVPYIATPVNCVSKQININGIAPRIQRSINIQTKQINVYAYVPVDIGTFMILPTTNISLIPNLPYRIGQGLPSAKVFIYGLQPGIRTSPYVNTTQVKINTSNPTIGSQRIINGVNINISAGLPYVSAVPEIDPWWPHVKILLNSDGAGYDKVTAKQPPWLNTGIQETNNKWTGMTLPSTVISQNSVINYNPYCMQVRSLASSGATVRPVFLPYPDTGVADGAYLDSAYKCSFTVEFWFRADTTSFSATVPKIIMGTQEVHGATTYENLTFSILGSTSGAVLRAQLIMVQSSTYTQLLIEGPANAVLPNTWHHACLMGWHLVPWNGNGGTVGHKFNFNLSVDGVGGALYVNAVDTEPYFTFLRSLVIGHSSPTGTATNEFVGYIDDIRITEIPVRGAGQEVFDFKYANNNTTSGTSYETFHRYTMVNGAAFTKPSKRFPRSGLQSETYRWMLNSIIRTDSSSALWWWRSGLEDYPSYWAPVYAVDQFVRDCKNDGIWSSITYCVPFVFRTLNVLSGSSTNGNDRWFPLVDPVLTGNAPLTASNCPQMINAPNASYSRYTGFKGNGFDVFIYTNSYSGDTPKDNNHYSAYLTNISTGPIFSIGYNANGATYMELVPGLQGTTHTNKSGILRTNGTDAVDLSSAFVGMSRSSSSSYSVNVPGFSGSINRISDSIDATQSTTRLRILERHSGTDNQGTSDAFGAHRILIYTHGTNIDLAKLKVNMQRLEQRLADLNILYAGA